MNHSCFVAVSISDVLTSLLDSAVNEHQMVVVGIAAVGILTPPRNGQHHDATIYIAYEKHKMKSGALKSTYYLGIFITCLSNLDVHFSYCYTLQRQQVPK